MFFLILVFLRNRILQILCLLLQAAFFWILPAFAHSRVPSGDTDYFQSSLDGEDLKLLVSESYRKNFSLLRRQSRRFYKEYGLLFHDSPQSRSYLVFVSPKTQMMNGAGVVSPVPLVFVYSGPGEDINRTASHNWLQDVLAHETAHLYQMSAQTKFSSRLRLFFPPVFWIIHPNIYLNRLILEGNAVLLESLYGTGGRLFSGWAKAFVFRQLKADISLKRIFNDYNDLFSHQEKYLHGGWFFLFLLKETLKNSSDASAGGKPAPGGGPRRDEPVFNKSDSDGPPSETSAFNDPASGKPAFSQSAFSDPVFAKPASDRLTSGEPVFSDPASFDSDAVHAGLRKIHEIFARHKNHILFPIAVQSLNRAFKKTFGGESFESLFEKYRQFYKEKAAFQKSAPEAPLFKSQTAAPLNSDEKQVYFLVSDGKSPPSLVTLDKETESFSVQKQDMPVGKAFFIDGDFYSAGTGQTESLKREIALFKDGFRSLQKSRSRYVMDIRGGKTAAFDTGQGPFGFPLLINDAFYDHIHSTAVLDESGRVYYFKQKGSERVLFANKNPLWSFKGFYGFPIEAGQALPSDRPMTPEPLTPEPLTPKLQTPEEPLIPGKTLTQESKTEPPFIAKANPAEAVPALASASLASAGLASSAEAARKPAAALNLRAAEDSPMRHWTFGNWTAEEISAQAESGGLKAAAVYFIGPTEYGSGLFVYETSKNRTLRLSPSDAIVAARRLKGDRFLVVEIAPFQYEYKIIAASPVPEEPFSAPDDFLPGKERFAQDASGRKEEALSSAPDDFLKGEEQKNLSPPSLYSPFLNLKFQDLTVAPLFGFSPPFLRSVNSRLRLTDPLQWNSAAFFASWAAPPPSKKSNKKPAAKAFRFHYLNKRRRLQWGLNFYFKNSPRLWIESRADAHLPDGLLNSSDRFIIPRDLFWESRGHYFSFYQFKQMQIPLNYLIWRRENHRLLFLSHFGYGKERFDFFPVRIKKEGRKISYSRDHRPAKREHYNSGFLNHRGALQLEYSKKYSEAFGRHRHWQISAYYDGSFLQKPGAFVFSYGGKAFFEKEAGREWFVSGGARIDRRLKTPFISRFFTKNEKNVVFNSHTFFMPLRADSVLGADLIVKKALNLSLYSLTLPVSLKRWAPLAGGALVFIQGDRGAAAGATDRAPPAFNLKAPHLSKTSESSALHDGSSPVFAHLFAGAEAELSLNYNADLLIGFSVGPIFEWANRTYFMERKNRIRRGFHTALSLKAVF